MFVFIFILRDSWIAFNSGRSKRKLCWVTWWFWRWESCLWWKPAIFGIIGGEYTRRASPQGRISTDGCLCAVYPERSQPVALQFPPTQTWYIRGWLGGQPAGRGAAAKGNSMEKVWKPERWVGVSKGYAQTSTQSFCLTNLTSPKHCRKTVEIALGRHK